MPRNLKFRALAVTMGLLIIFPLAGCSSWERTTFQTLSATKKVIDQAQADYEAGVIPKTAQAKSLIESAKKAQITAVDAMLKYEVVKADKAAGASEQQVVIEALSMIPQLVIEIKALYAPKISTMDSIRYTGRRAA